MKQKLRFIFMLSVLSMNVAFAYRVSGNWEAGFARRVITPKTPVWLQVMV
jgi:hypothetical protein